VRSGFVALAGRPNVGKSTLVNALCGAKVAIVSDKPQTTRHRIQGVTNGDGWQLVLVDVPGFQKPRDALTEHMQRTAESSLADVDAILLVLAADAAIGAGDRYVAARAFATGVPVVIALNKIDRLTPAEIARQIDVASQLGDFEALHPVSARTGDGLTALRDELAALLGEGPEFFPPGALSDMPIELRVAELVREQALDLTREEVPHAVTVEVEELSNGRVSATVFVETASQKQILVGKGGAMIREIGTRSRPEIERLLDQHVYLDLRVKVRERWRRDDGLLTRLGI